jgi:biopolymer transport protein ExbB
LGLIIVACIGVGVLIWKFMGNPSNFEGGNNETSIEYIRSGISRVLCAGIVRMLLMVLVFLLKFLISKAAGKDKLDAL